MRRYKKETASGFPLCWFLLWFPKCLQLGRSETRLSSPGIFQTWQRLCSGWSEDKSAFRGDEKSSKLVGLICTQPFGVFLSVEAARLRRQPGRGWGRGIQVSQLLPTPDWLCDLSKQMLHLPFPPYTFQRLDSRSPRSLPSFLQECYEIGAPLNAHDVLMPGSLSSGSRQN